MIDKLISKDFEKYCIEEDYEFVVYLYKLTNYIKHLSFFGKVKLLSKVVRNKEVYYDYDLDKAEIGEDIVSVILCEEKDKLQKFMVFVNLCWFVSTKRYKTLEDIYERRTIINNL